MEAGLKYLVRSTNELDLPIGLVADIIGQNPIAVARKVVNNKVSFENMSGDLVRLFASVDGFQGRITYLDKQKLKSPDYLDPIRIKVIKTTAEREERVARISDIRKMVKAAIKVMNSYDATRRGVSKACAMVATKAMVNDGYLTFVQFTCPVLAPEFLGSERPEEFISLRPEKSNMYTNLPRLRTFYRAMSDAGVKAKLKVIFADDDEQRYMGMGVKLPKFNKTRLEQRVGKYTVMLRQMIRRDMNISEVDFDVIVSSRLREQLPQVRLGYKDLELDEYSLRAERDITMSLLETRYAKQLAYSEEDAFDAATKISKAKFKTYAEQIAQIQTLYPNAILIQNEFPAWLREKMFRCGGSKIPTFYPYNERFRS